MCTLVFLSCLTLLPKTVFHNERGDGNRHCCATKRVSSSGDALKWMKKMRKWYRDKIAQRRKRLRRRREGGKKPNKRWEIFEINNKITTHKNNGKVEYSEMASSYLCKMTTFMSVFPLWCTVPNLTEGARICTQIKRRGKFNLLNSQLKL